MKNWIFIHCFALTAFPCRGCLYFALVYLFHYYFSKNDFESNYLFSISFHLIIFQIFLYSHVTFNFIFYLQHDYSFRSGKKWLFSEGFFLFLGKRVQSKNKQLFRQTFHGINFLIKPFLISTFNSQDVLNKWTGWHITEERTKSTKKWPNLIFA